MDKKKFNVKRFIIIHSIALAVLLFLFFVYKCPTHLIFGIPCPTCGITRACWSALTLDFTSAFAYHPLWPVTAPLVLLIAHRRYIKMPKIAETLILSAVGVAFLAVYVVRYVVVYFI